MGINARSSVHPQFSTHAKSALSGFETCVIEIIDPNAEALGNDFNPFANTFTNKGVVLWAGSGQVQTFRQAVNTFSAVGTVTQVRRIRFTSSDIGPQIPIREGMQVKVIACENVPDLLRYQFTINSPVTGDLAFTREFEAQVDTGTII